MSSEAKILIYPKRYYTGMYSKLSPITSSILHAMLDIIPMQTKSLHDQLLAMGATAPGGSESVN